MKQGWEIKKLGDVCDIICGQDYKTVQDCNGEYPIYGTGGIMGYASKYRCPANSIIIGRKGSINNPLFVNCKFWNVDTAFGVVPNTAYLIPKYFYLFCKQYDFTRHDVSVTIPSLRRTDILQIEVPVPPLPDQERIVAELDCLSSIIEKQKEQLKELDNLAQSTFYTMFGDPITNEKGWVVRRFEECYKLASGQGLSAKDIVLGNYPVYGGNGIVGYHQEYNLDGDNIIIGRVGALCGNVRNVLGKAFITDNAFILTKMISNVNTYLLYLLRLHNLRKYAREAMQPVVSNTGLKNISIIIPPLCVQQEFASKIEMIEKQKELIKQSIAETETLFNSRMEYYFN